MTCAVNKVGNSGKAFSYFSEKDDYYLADKSSAFWYGEGAGKLGLYGDINPHDFKAVLDGKAGDQQVGREGFHEVMGADGKTKKIPNHTPGWDATFDAPKSVSIAALIDGDKRLIAAHDAAVKLGLEHLQQYAMVTRQRGADGGYEWRNVGSMVAGVVRHSSSRDLDPQLHSHAIIANMACDPKTGKWVSIDSRAGLYLMQKEAGNIYMNELARRVRALGYEIEWRVGKNGNVVFEITRVPAQERELFSSRTHEIKAELAARGLDKDTASGAAREAATLATRRAKEHVKAAVLHARWLAKALAAGFTVGAKQPRAKRLTPEQRMTAARAAVTAGIASIGERETRFTRQQLLAEATTYAQGRAAQEDLAFAVLEAHDRGDLLDRGVTIRGYGKELETAAGFTTRAARETEEKMLASAAAIAEKVPTLRLNPAAIDALIAGREAESGHAFTTEQRAVTKAILEGRSSLSIVQGFAGTAKTTSVLAAIAKAAERANVRVRALAPTHSAADTLGAAIGAESQTVAALNNRALDPDGRSEVWIVDEAGMVSAADMKALLVKADRAGAQVILTGDTRQIGSVGAGSAFQQIQEQFGDRLSSLTDIKRQTSAELKSAVYDSLAGNFSEALGKVDTREIRLRGEAVEAIADAYMQHTLAGKQTLVVTLSRDDRRDVNAAIQARREAAGEVRGAQKIATLQPGQRTGAELADASRYQAGDVIEAGRAFRHGPEKGELVTVSGVDNGKVTAQRATGESWTFNPARTNKFALLEKGQTRIGAGDRIVSKGAIQARDAAEPDKRVAIKNGTVMSVTGVSQDGKSIAAKLADGRGVTIDASRGAKVDLAYAQTANQAQGQTVDVAVAYMRSGQTNLADRQHAYVALSRAREHATVVTDDREKLAATLAKSAHGKQAALDHEAARSDAEQDARRPLSARAKDMIGDIKAKLHNGLEDSRLRAKQREHERFAARDKAWLRKGYNLTRKIERNSGRAERDIAKRYGTDVRYGGNWDRLFDSTRAGKGRKYIESIRAGRERALDKINASMERAFERQVQREMQRSHVGAEQARETAGEQVLIDRNFRMEAAAIKAFDKAADVTNRGADALKDAIARGRAAFSQHTAERGSATTEPTPFDAKPAQRSDPLDMGVDRGGKSDPLDLRDHTQAQPARQAGHAAAPQQGSQQQAQQQKPDQSTPAPAHGHSPNRQTAKAGPEREHEQQAATPKHGPAEESQQQPERQPRQQPAQTVPAPKHEQQAAPPMQVPTPAPSADMGRGR